MSATKKERRKTATAIFAAMVEGMQGDPGPAHIEQAVQLADDLLRHLEETRPKGTIESANLPL